MHVCTSPGSMDTCHLFSHGLGGMVGPSVGRRDGDKDVGFWVGVNVGFFEGGEVVPGGVLGGDTLGLVEQSRCHT